MNSNIAFLLLFHIALFIVALTDIIKEISINKKVILITYFKIYYFIFLIVPPIFILLNFNSDYLVYYNTREILYYYSTFFIIGMFYLFICIFSKKRKSSIADGEYKYSLDSSSKYMLFVNILFSMIGLISLLLWTKAYGRPWDMIKYANKVRSGYVVVNNPFTFMKPFCKFSFLALLGFLFCKNKKHKILSLVFIVLNIFTVVIYSLASDSRSYIITCIIIILMCRYNNNINLKFSFKKIIKISSLIALIVILFSQLDSITNYIRTQQYTSGTNKKSVSYMVIKNFGYPYRNIVNVQHNIVHGEYKGTTELRDISNIFIAFLPTSIKNKYTKNLERVNTEYYSELFGEVPPDVITSSFYKFNYLGLIIMPIILCFIIFYLEEKLSFIAGDYQRVIYNQVGGVVCYYLVSFYDMSIILFVTFYLIIGFIVTKFFCKKTIKNSNELSNVCSEG